MVGSHFVRAVLGLLVLAMSAFAPHASANNNKCLIHDHVLGGSYKTLQAAVDATADGGTLEVRGTIGCNRHSL